MSEPPAPLSMFFPVGAVLAYANGDVRPVLDPECRHEACRCCLRAEQAQQWNLFCKKAHAVVAEAPPSLRGDMPTLRVVSEQNAQVVLVTMRRDRFGAKTVTDESALT